MAWLGLRLIETSPETSSPWSLVGRETATSAPMPTLTQYACGHLVGDGWRFGREQSDDWSLDGRDDPCATLSTAQAWAP